ncbi:specifically androgen-regulated gene protein [Anomaloglossus baeobatrachus]|uniref:specifically androgen-regulated gene protein n=1 Tax=Anomaloglossus baeobatrachus TaxID=238106 RepID=UPI003F4FB2C8
MPEKTLWTRHVGMAALNSVGSTGSCDSMESISSNHSAFSGDGYDHLSAEERECLMFLEETIDSLDNEDDSGVSNDELETPEKSTSHSTAEPAKVTTSSGNEKPRPLSTVFLQAEEWTPVAKIPQGYHSFPRIIQVSREENPVHTAESKVPESDSDQAKSWYGKPKSMSSINRPQTVEPPIDFLIIPPPEPFRDPQVLIDKRRSVTDPTDARELRYEKPQFRPPTISENKELPPVVKPFSMPTPLLFPRVTSPKTTTSSQETISQVEDKSVDAKQGPPTAPKPRTLPPHIIIKSSSGVVSNLDPQSRPRTFSAHERYMDRAPEPSIPKVTHSKEHERARLEALQKLGFIVKSSSQENISLRASKTDLSIAHVGDQGDQDLNRKSDVNQQHRVDLMGTTSTQPSTILKADDRQVRSESPSKSVKIIKSSSVEKVEPVSGTTLIQKTPNAVEISPQHIKSSIFDRSRPSVKAKAQEKADVVIQTSKPLNEVPTATDGSRNTVDSTKHKSPSHSHASSKVDNKSGPSGYSANILTTESDLSLKQGLDRKPSTLKATPVEKQTVFPEIHPAPFNSSGPLSIGEKPQEKVGSFENISHISTSPGKPFSFPRPKEIVVTPHSPEVQGKEQVPDKSNRHSTHFEPSNEPYLRFPQGSVPGLRQINIKANTLERSGVGLSGSMSSIEKESQKANGSFFKKPLFSGNFLRSNRPRPASLGTGKDFAYLESSTVDGETTEKRSFFSRPRSSGPVTSVKITPKGTSEEHRKEALKKLGILKE